MITDVFISLINELRKLTSTLLCNCDEGFEKSLRCYVSATPASIPAGWAARCADFTKIVAVS